MLLRRWAVGPTVNNSFPEHISESTCPIVFKFYTQHPWGVQLCLLGYMNSDLLLVQNYDLFRRFDAHFVSGADLEKYWADDSHIAHTCSLRSLVVPFQVSGP